MFVQTTSWSRSRTFSWNMNCLIRLADSGFTVTAAPLICLSMSVCLSALERDELIILMTWRVWVDRRRFNFYLWIYWAGVENLWAALRTEETRRPSRAARVFLSFASHVHTHSHCHTWVFLMRVCACPSHVPLQSSRPPAMKANHRPPPHNRSPWQRSVGHVTSVYSLIITGARSPSHRATFSLSRLRL